MCGIAGFASFGEDFLRKKIKNENIVASMGNTMRHRGPDDFGTYIDKHVAFAHTRLAVMDPKRGKQPMVKQSRGKEYVIVYNGEVYNADEMRVELRQRGYEFETGSDTEVVLCAYIAYGEKMVDMLNGIYSFVIWDSLQEKMFLCRDRLGVKPLFYTWKDGCFLFASEIKGLLKYPKMKACIGRFGLCELFGIGPARVPGCGVYEGIYEVLPGYCGSFTVGGWKQWKYWEPKTVKIEHSYEEAVERVKKILTDAIIRQLRSDVPICTLLSGGLDSSVVSAVAAKHFAKKGKKLATYSFDYENNRENFKASSFQPEQDRPYVEEMVSFIASDHRYLECDQEELYRCLLDAVVAKDMPGMTDVDASLLYFSGEIKKHHTVCLSGECADEVFGGYPWFRAEESFQVDRFPWSRDLEFRKSVLKKEVVGKLPIEEYVEAQYRRSLSNVSYLREEMENDSKARRKRRERQIAYLNIQWFMETLLERKDRMTMAKGLEVRVPFADYRLVEYLYALPWEYKYFGGNVKSLLKDAMKEYLPKSVLERKKCPYPKTYDPRFENKVKGELASILQRKDAPINELVDREYLFKLMKRESDYGKPWFGQLMALPQMYAYLLQMNVWLESYQVDIFM